VVALELPAQPLPEPHPPLPAPFGREHDRLLR
jgi:hypothetical protein